MTLLPRTVLLGTLIAIAVTQPIQARSAVSKAKPAASPKHFVFDTHKFMRVSEVRPGMRGYALTVFKGTKIEKFNIEVLGVVSKFNNGKDYILFRALDGPPVTRQLNIAHGMSGSPIYINGRLVGAISMGIPGTQFPKEPIALATPIEEMFDAWSPDLPSTSATMSAMSAPGTTNNTSNGGVTLGQWGTFEPIGMPLSVSGMSPRGLARLSTDLAPYHLTVNAMAGGGGGDNGFSFNDYEKTATLQPGSAVGVSLVQGDVDVTATGTVTYRDGNRLLLFGHPLADLGPLDAALTTAYVVSIFPSYQDSIKLGAPLKTVGRIFQDRPFSVGGIIGPMPNMIPMSVVIDDHSIKQHKEYHVRIINHPLLTARFVTSIADQLIAQVHGEPGDSIARVTMDVDVDEIGHVVRTNTFYDSQSIDQSAVSDLDSLMRLLQSNQFYPLGVKSVKVNVSIENSHNTAEIERIFLKQSKFAPGDTVDVGVVMHPFKKPSFVKTVSIKIPLNTPNGPLTLSVKGGGSDGGSTISLGGLILVQSSAPSGIAANVHQLVKQFKEKAKNNELVTRLLLPTTAINVAGERLSMLPPNLVAAMQGARSTGLRTERDEVKVVQPTQYIVSGAQALTITVEKKSAIGPAPSTTTPASTSPTPASSTTMSSSDDSYPDSPLEGESNSVSTGVGNDLVALTPNLVASGAPNSISPAPVTQTVPIVHKTQATTAAPAKGTTGAKPIVPTDTYTRLPKAVGRLPSVWRQASAAEFTAGTLKNVAVTSVGDLRLSPALVKLAETNETYVWALQPDAQGHIFVGTGDNGIIFKADANGKLTRFFQTGELEVNALAQDAAGNLYAGTSPHGIVFKITPDGKGKPWFRTHENYVTALAYDNMRNRLYVATGGGTGCVYAVPDTGIAAANAWFTSSDAHVLSLALDKTGNVFAGTSPSGLVYKISPDGVSQVWFDASEASVSALATDSKGDVIAGTTPRGILYRIAPDGTSKVLYDRMTTGVLALRAAKNDDIYACGGSTIYRISPDETTQLFTAPSDEQFLTLTVDNANDVYAGGSTVGALYKIAPDGPNGLQGQFQSTVRDAGLSTRWGAIEWSADIPVGTQLTLQTRSGDVETPDSSWSAWSTPYTQSGQSISSPPARYLQYMVTFTGTTTAIETGHVPRLRSVTIYYLPRNQAPTVKLATPQMGDEISKSFNIQWQASDSDKDVLTYELSYSSDGGTTWTPLRKRAQPNAPVISTPTTTTVKTATTKPMTDGEIARKVAEMQVDLDKHPELPLAVRQQILSNAALSLGTPGTDTSAASTMTVPLKDSAFPWDTTEVPDGVYQIQVIASDKTSNPDGALTAHSISGYFTVANTVPTMLLEVPTVQSDGSVVLHGSAKTGIINVRAVQYRVDGGDPIAASADDGLFDSRSEAFTITTGVLTKGTHKIDVSVGDRADNWTTQSKTVTVP